MRLSLARFIAPLSCVLLLVPVLASARLTDATTGLGATGQAAGLSTGCTGSATACITTMLGRALNILFGFLGIVLLGYVLYGGFVWMTASGSKEVDQAQGIIRNAVIGVVIIACSFAISDFALRQVGNIAGGGEGGTGTSDSSAATDARLDALMDGATRPCCYANPAPMTTCVADCQRTPTAFGLTAPVTEDACILPCGSRVCTGGTPADPRPVAGQAQCTAGAPTSGSSVPGATTVCADFLRIPIPVDRCSGCVAQCQRDTVCNSNPSNNFGHGSRDFATQDQLNTQRGTCREIVCTGSGDCPR
jgi:hypothetical protein